MSTANLYQREVVWHSGEKEQSSPERPRWLWIVVAGAVCLTLMLAFGIGQRYRPCSDFAEQQTQIQHFLSSGQTSMAVGMAQDVLSRTAQPACPSSKSALLGLWYSASIDQVLSTPPLPTTLSQQAATNWLATEQKADGFGLSAEQRLPAIRISQRAYSAGLWQLANLAFRRAWDRGEIGPDQALFRYAILRNLGNSLLTTQAPTDRTAAILYLGTATSIATTYGLANAEACMDLKGMGFLDCTQIQSDPSEPMLVNRTKPEGSDASRA